MDDLKLKFILVILVAAAFLTGFFIFQQFTQRGASTKQRFENIPVSPTPVPSPDSQRIPTVRGQATASANQLPNTAAPVVLIGILAVSALVSGYFLRKFPE